MDFNKADTALVVIDPQNDVLSEKGVSWGLVGASVKENNTVENLRRLFEAAQGRGFGIFIRWDEAAGARGLEAQGFLPGRATPPGLPEEHSSQRTKMALPVRGE